MNGQVVRLTTHSLDQADMWAFGSFANNRDLRKRPILPPLSSSRRIGTRIDR